MHPSLTQLALVALFTSSRVPSALAHGYIKLWSADGGSLQHAQKTGLQSTSYRGVSDNTGWVGSHFISGQSITCGASNTPRMTVTAPSGTFFNTAAQSAGQTMPVKAGGKINLVVSGNPGQGWPHPNGHVQAYLGMCGTSATACQNFDASQASYFKILGEKNGIQNTLRPAYDGSVDGNRYSVPIPANLTDGSYIFRFELIAFGQSSPAEGQQDQYYPFCGQISVTGGSAKSNAFATVKFPGAYKDGNIDQSTLPGPTALASGPASGAPTTNNSGSSGSTSGTGSSSSGSGSSSSGKCKRRRRRHFEKRRLVVAAQGDFVAIPK